MEIIGQGLMAIGEAVKAIAGAFGTIYVTAIIAKTFLIYTEKVESDKMSNWFDFWNWKKGRRL